MAWIELHQAIRDHRKIIAAAGALDIPEPHMIGHLACLWLWSLDNAPTGELPGSNQVVARAAQWTGDPDDFVDALIGCDLVDEDGPARLIHDWDDYAGKLLERRESNKTRMREARARNVQSTDEERADTCRATVPYSTVPNPTEQNQGKEPPLVPPAGAKPKQANRNHRIPDDWTPSPGVVRVAQELHMDLPTMQAELDKFASHFRANGKTMVDWNQAAMNWLRRSLDFAKPQQGNGRVTDKDIDHWVADLQKQKGIA